MSRAQLRLLLKDVGLNVEAKDLRLLFGRIDHDATNCVSRYHYRRKKQQSEAGAR